MADKDLEISENSPLSRFTNALDRIGDTILFFSFHAVSSAEVGWGLHDFFDARLRDLI